MPQVHRTAVSRNRKGRWRILQSLFFIFIFSTAIYMLLHSSLFRVREIVVEGNKLLSKQDVMALTGLSKDLNIFKANLKLAGEKVSLHPMIKEVKITRDLPARIVIKITERKQIGLLIDTGGFIVVGEDGCYLKKVTSLTNVNLPIITGVKPSGSRPGQIIADDRLKSALSYLLTMPANLRAAVSEMNVSDSNNIKMYTIDGAEIRFGDNGRIAEKIKLFQEVIGQKYQNRILYIDISYKGRPVIKFFESSRQENERPIDTEIYD